VTPLEIIPRGAKMLATDTLSVVSASSTHALGLEGKILVCDHRRVLKTGQ